MNRILIAVPTFESILPETFKSIYGLQIPEDCVCQFDFVKGYGCAKARNDIALEAMEHNFDYVLMVDSDIILPSHTLTSMLEVPVDIALGVYPRKNTSTGQTECFKYEQDNFVDVYTYDEIDALEQNLVRIKGGGLGCALIRTEVFGTLLFPYFNYVTYNNGLTLSEDNYFCNKASKAGYDIYMNIGVQCGHSIKAFQWQ